MTTLKTWLSIPLSDITPTAMRRLRMAVSALCISHTMESTNQNTESKQIGSRLVSEGVELEIYEVYEFNIRNQEHLAAELMKIVDRVGLDTVANRLEYDPLILKDRIRTLDLSMTELRYLAHACNVEIGFSIS